MWNKTVAVFLAWILCCGLFSSLTPACGNGWFGSSCQYKCHCTNNNCDDNGTCTSGSTCIDGWFGPACQYVNLATGRTSSATDNNDKTCIENVNIQEVTVSLTTSTLFTWMRIVFKDPDQVPDFQLQFKPNDQDSVIDCKNLRNATVTKTSMDIHCDLDVAVDEVILKGEGVKSLCSIYISGGRNVALRQNTNQSSINIPYTSERAVDGNTNTFTHTNIIRDHNPTWNLTFTQPKLVNRYVIYNRHNCCKNRLIGFILQSSSQDGTIVFNYTDKKTSAQNVYNVISTGAKQPISHVMIQATYVDRLNPLRIVLTLGEVEIFGESDCPEGKYGLDCNQTCNCDKKDETCFVSTGGCPSGCSSGFYGEDCQTECPPKYHGIECKEKCNTNCLNEICVATTGVCIECGPGIMGDYCQADCSNNKFGQRCIETCSDNCQDGSSMDRVCDSVNGTCLYGCKVGYLGLQCNEITPYTGQLLSSASTACVTKHTMCLDEEYGPNCAFKSSFYCNRNFTKKTSVCHHENGQCLHGCINGFEGDICTTTGKDRSTDDNPGLKIGIGISCGLLAIAVIVIIIFVLRRFKNSRKERNQQPSISYNHTDVNQEDVEHYRDLYIDADGYNLPRNHGNVQESMATYEDITGNVKDIETKDDTNHYDYIRDEPQTNSENQTRISENMRQNVMYENQLILKEGEDSKANES